MALIDRIAADRLRVFVNPHHFASTHTWNGVPFPCVTDEEEALKRKNNNVNDISWDNNTIDVLVYVRAEDWPGRKPPVPNEAGFFDNARMMLRQISNDMGMYAILLTAQSPKAVTAE